MRARVFISMVVLLVAGIFPKSAQGVPKSAEQVIAAVADSWGSSRGKLQAYQRTGTIWKPLFAKPIPVLFGKNGLAWGVGALPVPHGKNGIPSKREGDKRAPAGCFEVGKIYGYASKLPKGGAYPYRQVTKWDAWIDDAKNPLYNRHIVVDPKKKIPAWFEKGKMRHGDFAYEWLIEVRHNSDPPKAGAGSAIFFHIRRGASRTTAGCTTMQKANVTELATWLRSKKNPHYVLLPKAEYAKRVGSWKLPPMP